MIKIAVASRPFPGETVSGDACRVDWDGPLCRIAMIDGLGHGPDAALAAQTARDQLASSPHLGPADALRLCHGALRSTRGAAISIVVVDPLARRLVSAGIGNVDVVVRNGRGSRRYVSDRGIVGGAFPTIRPVEVELDADWLLILHTDGVSARFDLDVIPETASGSPDLLADTLLGQWARKLDDAMVVVAIPNGSS